MKLRPRVSLATVVLATVVVMTSARSGSPSTGQDSGAEVLVFAAASLTDAFKALGAAFEHDHPGTTVRFSFAGSQQLARQILHGAPADVFASADPRQLEAVAASVVGEPRLIAANTLSIVVEPGNPRGVRSLADLARPDLTAVLASEEVPAGRYARQALQQAGVEVSAVSLEDDVRGVLLKVRLGEADAGIAYTTDVLAAGGTVEAVPVGPDDIAHYPIAVLASSSNPDGARAFVNFAQSVEGQAILRRHGFLEP